MDRFEKLILEKAKMEGHFVFASGNHATQKLDFDNVARNRLLILIVARRLAKMIADKYPEVDAIVTIATGANVLAKPTANSLSKLLNREVVPVETSKDSDKNFSLTNKDLSLAGLRVVIVDDVFNHGTNSDRVIKLLSSLNAQTLAVAVVFNRNTFTKLKSSSKIKLLSLITYPMKDWPKEECTTC